MGDFSKYAPYLQHPLVLVGFALFLVLGTHRVLIRSGIIPRLSARSGSVVLRSLLRYGFVMALTVVACGFGLEYFKVYKDVQANKELTQVLNRVYDKGDVGEPHVSYVRLVGRLAAKDRSTLQDTIREAERVLQESGIRVSAENLVLLGGLYLTVGQYEKANATFLDAVNEDKKNIDAYAGLAMANQLRANELMRQREYDRAQEALEKADGYAKLGLQDDPSNGPLLLQMGYVEKELANYYADKGDTRQMNKAQESALRLFKMAIGADPKDAGAHNGLGDIYYLRGEYDAAIQEFETATNLLPGYTFSWFDMVIALQQKYVHSGKPDPQTIRQLLQALQKLYELQSAGIGEKLPPGAWQSVQQIKDWALAEAARLKKTSATSS